MIDAKSAAEIAVFVALNAVIVGASVYQDAPENVALPVVIVGDMTSAPMGAKCDLDREISVAIVAQVAAEERKPLLDLQGQIEIILDGANLSHDGWIIRPVFEGDDAALGSDGATYVGTSNFRVFALRDD